MFDRYGEFDSWEEMNEAAEGQLQEGDMEAIREIAKENGIDAEDAQDYIDGFTKEFVNPVMVAHGKLKVEAEELKPQEIMEDWINYIRVRCLEDERMALAVRRRGKTLKGCISEILKWSLKNMYPVDKDIAKAAGVNQSVKLGIPGSGRAKQIITEYYLGK